jgi:hypothetical protein
LREGQNSKENQACAVRELELPKRDESRHGGEVYKLSARVM